MSPRIETTKAIHSAKLFFNVDIVAISIALAAAALVRLNVIPHIGW